MTLAVNEAEQTRFIVRLAKGVFSTPDMCKTEQRVIKSVNRLLTEKKYQVDSNRAIKEGISTDKGKVSFSEEQQGAIKSATGESAFAIIQGRAGTGKSTMLQAVRESYEQAGFKVQGIALAGQAAQNLQKESGIESKTIASWSMQKDLNARTVIIMDEAGMVGSKQMAEVIKKVEMAGAKLILVGDEKQLQPIAAGGILRVTDKETQKVAPEYSSAVVDIRRQREPWMKEIVTEAAQGHVEKSLEALDKRGKINVYSNAAEARSSLVDKFIKENKNDVSEGIVMTNRKYDVQKINEEIREKLQEQGYVKKEGIKFDNDNREIELAEGDRVIFTRNEYKNLDVRNGQRGIVEDVDEKRHSVTIKLDNGEQKEINIEKYNHLEYGWACTTHKAQGATVERSYIYGFTNDSMPSRQSTYVQISRAKEETKLYVIAGERGVEREGVVSTVNEADREEAIETMKKSWGRDAEKDTTLEYPLEKEQQREMELKLE